MREVKYPTIDPVHTATSQATCAYLLLTDVKAPHPQLASIYLLGLILIPKEPSWLESFQQISFPIHLASFFIKLTVTKKKENN